MARRRLPALLTMLACLLPALLLGAGCAGMARRMYEPPRVTLSRIQVKKVTLLSADLVLRLRVENPNRLALVLLRGDYRMRVGDRRVLAGRRDERAEIPARGEGFVDLPATAGMADLASLVALAVDIARNPPDVLPRYTLEGTLVFDVPVRGETVVPLHHEVELSLDWLDALRLGSSRPPPG